MRFVVNDEIAFQWKDMSEEEFYEFCSLNDAYRIERTAAGDILIMAPAGGETGNRNLELSLQLGQWTKRDGRGVAFDSSTAFVLPNGATRSPDAAWVLRSRLAALTREQKRRFLPLCPDFLVELTSPSDRLSKVQEKMLEWMANGAELGWVLDTDNRQVLHLPAQWSAGSGRAPELGRRRASERLHLRSFPLLGSRPVRIATAGAPVVTRKRRGFQGDLPAGYRKFRCNHSTERSSTSRLCSESRNICPSPG